MKIKKINTVLRIRSIFIRIRFFRGIKDQEKIPTLIKLSRNGTGSATLFKRIYFFSYDILTSGKISSVQTASLPSLFIRSFSEIRVKMQNSYSRFCRVKKCPYTNMVHLGQSSTLHGPNCPDYQSGSVIWISAVIRICNPENFGQDKLEIGKKKPYFYADNF